jgi:hypothetical protein
LIDWRAEIGIEPEWRESPLDLKHGRGRGEGSQASCTVNNMMSAQATRSRLADAALRALLNGEIPSKRTCAPTMSSAAFAKHWPPALADALRFVDAARLDELANLGDSRYAALRQGAADESDRRLGERMLAEERIEDRIEETVSVRKL